LVFFSTRPHLGHTLLESGKYEEAEAVLKQDLEILSENGLALSLEKRAKTEKKAIERFERTWKYTSIELKGVKAYNSRQVTINIRQTPSGLTFAGVTNCSL